MMLLLLIKATANRICLPLLPGDPRHRSSSSTITVALRLPIASAAWNLLLAARYCQIKLASKTSRVLERSPT